MADKQKYKSLLLRSAEVMGLLYHDAEDWFKGNLTANSEVDEAEIKRLINERLEAKKSKDWSKADAIRSHLKEQGIILEDTPQGTTWKKE